MNIVMVSYMDFTGPGVIHMFHFANGLVRLGHRVLFLLNGDPLTVKTMEEPPLFDIEPIRFKQHSLHSRIIGKVRRFHAHIIHIWTPRNVPARVGLELLNHFHCRFLIHYEDDEDILAEQSDFRFFQFFSFSVDSFLHPEKWVWSHPFTYSLVNLYADALTVISPEYRRKLRKKWPIPNYLLTPGVDLDRFSPQLHRDEKLLAKYRLQGKKVLLYGGSIAQFYEFSTVLDAFRKISKNFPDTVLIQYGRNFMKQEIAEYLGKHGLDNRVILVGQIPHFQVPAFLSLGDILIQAGQDTIFNRHRLPSKIPEYLAMGKPVITFSCGIGEEFEHLVDVWKLHEGTVDELAQALESILSDENLQETLALGARKAAERLFSWPERVNHLVTIYNEVLLGPQNPEIPSLMHSHEGFDANILKVCREKSRDDEKALPQSSSLWDELLGLREFHRKVTGTLLYKIYFQLKLVKAKIMNKEEMK